MMMKTIDDNPYIDEEVKKVISQFDTLYTEKDTAGIKNNIKITKELASNVASIVSQIHIYYSIATALGDILHLEPYNYSEEVLIDQLYNFRMAIDCAESRTFSTKERPYVAGCLIQLFTNYANALSSMGRTIEAIRYYKRALSIHTDFGMAEGNLGIEYIHYADLDFDKGHSQIFHYVGYKYLKSALKHKRTIVESEAIAYFQQKIDIFASEYVQDFLEKDLNLGKYSLGRKKEADYRTWVMNHGLFLNTMNDLPFTDNFMAADVLHLPSMIMKTANGLNYKHHGLFNQIKQEYITARYLIFESQQGGTKAHFADKHTDIMDTLDYTIYSIRIEKMKLAFRALYSLYDKIAYFINDYFELGIPLNNVTYRKIWCKSAKEMLMVKQNLLIYGLFWISKEFFDKDDGIQVSTKPKAKRIYEIRQALEHKYLKITDYDMRTSKNDSLAFYVTYQEFEKELFDLVHLVRESIIYLSLAVHLNELQKRAGSPDETYVNMPLFKVEDEWKM
ncbi:hypothetical protein AT727_08815 [Desulfitobacterium hafniense]|uniref:LA2681-like HEPN domain-containing protein n=1 Tax=Desulfitobacterium hafniense TaxID=49338 RepID=A0A0W1JEK4_DESHA|nr:LA2681 family HEPN domain-containing protein [Desulfitobacterium hafniense]KTE90019.1 hypothetical protein AT727_08815 [Desulfitobacterium hafniense]